MIEPLRRFLREASGRASTDLSGRLVPVSSPETREDRVSDWRSFNKKKKKRTKGPEVLG